MTSSSNRTTDVLNKDADAPSLFKDLLLSPTTLQGLVEAGFNQPSPIQAKAIPLGRCGLDLIVQAKSGTGKTLVFGVIALEALSSFGVGSFGNRLQVLVLSPTREIAVQSQRVLTQIGKFYENLKVSVFIGGLPTANDVALLSGCQVAVGSPGRIKALITSGDLQTDAIRLLILDEADLLLHENFQPTINWIYSTLPESKQILALSATYTEQLAQHLLQYMKNPTFVRLNAIDPALLGIRQYYLEIESHHLPNLVFDKKAEKLVHLLRRISFQQCLVFSNYQTRAEDLSRLLTSRGWPSVHIGSALEQTRRLEVYDQLRSFTCRVLVTTDLSSRGIDAENVDLVVNLDLPWEHETYLHRIGRAGRFGRYGAAISLVSKGAEKSLLKNIERDANTEIKSLPDPVPSNLTASTNVMDLESLVSTQLITSYNDCVTASVMDSHKAAILMNEENCSLLTDIDTKKQVSCAAKKDFASREMSSYKNDLKDDTNIDTNAILSTCSTQSALKIPTLADEMSRLGLDGGSLSQECQAELEFYCDSPASQVLGDVKRNSRQRRGGKEGGGSGKNKRDYSKENFTKKQPPPPPRTRKKVSAGVAENNQTADANVQLTKSVELNDHSLNSLAAEVSEFVRTQVNKGNVGSRELNKTFLVNDLNNFLQCMEECFPTNNCLVKTASRVTLMPTWSEFEDNDMNDCKLEQNYRASLDYCFGKANSIGDAAELNSESCENLNCFLQRLLSQCKLKKVKSASSNILIEVPTQNHQSIQTDDYENLQANVIKTKTVDKESQTMVSRLHSNTNSWENADSYPNDLFSDDELDDKMRDFALNKAIEVTKQQLIVAEETETHYLQLYHYWCEQYESAFGLWMQQQCA